jgi:hypothetical protein
MQRHTEWAKKSLQCQIFVLRRREIPFREAIIKKQRVCQLCYRIILTSCAKTLFSGAIVSEFPVCDTHITQKPQTYLVARSL